MKSERSLTRAGRITLRKSSNSSTYVLAETGSNYRMEAMEDLYLDDPVSSC